MHQARAQILSMRHRIYVHLVWTTRDRAPLIDTPTAVFLERFLSSVAHQERTQLLALGIVSTHVHLLLRLHPTTVIPRLLQRLKGGSAVVAARECNRPVGYALLWAKGYNIQSVSEQALERVRAYVERQPLHHPLEAIVGWPGPATDSAVALATGAESRL